MPIHPRLLRQRFGDRPAALAVYLAVAVAVGVAAVFTVLGVVALADLLLGGRLGAMDRAVLEGLVGRRRPGTMEAALYVTALGNTLTLAVLVAWCAAALWRAAGRLEAGLLVLIFAAGRLVTELGKAVFGRPRPDVLEWGVHVTSPTFPSAHAMASAMVFGALAWLLSRPLFP